MTCLLVASDFIPIRILLHPHHLAAVLISLEHLPVVPYTMASQDLISQFSQESVTDHFNDPFLSSVCETSEQM